MPTRRLPTGGLAALAVVLAALAVVVVTGARGPLVRLESAPRPTHSPAPPHRNAPPTTLPHRGGAASQFVDSRQTDTQRTLVVRVVVTTNTTTTVPAPPPSSTTTVPTTTPPSVPPPVDPSRFGYFEGGATSATKQLDVARAVTVTVPAGIEVSLSVTCGLTPRSATSMTSVTVYPVGAADSCIATFSVPADTPGPARWELATT